MPSLYTNTMPVRLQKLTQAQKDAIIRAWHRNPNSETKDIAALTGTSVASAHRYKPLSLRVRKGKEVAR